MYNTLNFNHFVIKHAAANDGTTSDGWEQEPSRSSLSHCTNEHLLQEVRDEAQALRDNIAESDSDTKDKRNSQHDVDGRSER